MSFKATKNIHQFVSPIVFTPFFYKSNDSQKKELIMKIWISLNEFDEDIIIKISYLIALNFVLL